jgi:hypothetical protein
MAKKKSVIKDEIVIKSTKPEFKPGNKPYLEYDGVVLNANVPWNELVAELKNSGKTKSAIAKYAECELDVINQIEAKNFDNLCFRSGARIITLHSQQFPACYN